MTIYERVKYLRKEYLKMTQEDFSKKINISRSNLGSIETGRVNVTDRVISDICNVFLVNEDWLRNGGADEKIPVKLSDDEELAMYTQMLLDSSTDDVVANMIKKFICIYEKLDSDSKKVLMDIVDELISKQKNE